MQRLFQPLLSVLPCTAILWTALLSAACPADEFFFRPSDRVLFLGDSITEQYQYSSYIELYLTSRFPKANMTFLNAGIGGDTAGGGASRFKAHVLAEKPTAVTINFGMNDGGYGAFDENRNKVYREKTAEMLALAKEAGVRVALISPNAVDRRVSPRFIEYLETQQKFYSPLKDLAASGGALFVDQYATTRVALEKMESVDKTAKDIRPFGDGFHTSSSGGMLMAHAILTGLKAPGTVSNVEIDAKAKKASTENCTVEQIGGDDSGLKFQRLDAALPIAVQKDWLSVMPYMNDLKDLNWYGLKVTGLAAGEYTLSIDGKPVGSFTHEALATGVNAGNLLEGPIYEQAQKVFAAVAAKNQMVHQRFRGVVMFQAPDWLADVAQERKAGELAKRLDRIAAAQADIYKLAQPTAHTWELTLKK